MNWTYYEPDWYNEIIHYRECMRFDNIWNEMILCTLCDVMTHACCVIYYHCCMICDKIFYPYCVIWDKMSYFWCVIWDKMLYSSLLVWSVIECPILAVWSGMGCPLLAMWSDIGGCITCNIIDGKFAKCVETTPHSCNLTKECDNRLNWGKSTNM